MTGNLVLAVKLFESVEIEGPCRVTLVQAGAGDRVRLAIEAAPEVRIKGPKWLREEVKA